MRHLENAELWTFFVEYQGQLHLRQIEADSLDSAVSGFWERYDDPSLPILPPYDHKQNAPYLVDDQQSMWCVGGMTGEGKLMLIHVVRTVRETDRVN